MLTKVLSLKTICVNALKSLINLRAVMRCLIMSIAKYKVSYQTPPMEQRHYFRLMLENTFFILYVSNEFCMF